jgi:AcrR family transcriptional regulator
MGRTRTHGSQTAAVLLAAAERIAASDGVDALSVRRVADEANTTTRAVYSLFGSKDGLLIALASHGFHLLAAEVAALPVTDDPTEDVVAAGAVVFRRFALEHSALFRINFQRESVTLQLATGFDIARRDALSQLIRRFDRLDGLGNLQSGQAPNQAALLFHALCEGLASLELRDTFPAEDAAQIWHTALRALVVGLRPERPAS